jgi:flagellar hook-associated protein 1 FlgK
MSVSDVFSIGLTALYAQKLALEVTSENISNVNTPGYSKQTAILETGIPNLDSRFPVGSGVRVATIRRVYDDFLQKQLVSSNSSSGNYSALQTQTQRVEQLFNEFSTAGLGTDLTSFFNAWQDLADNPSGQAERQAVLAQGETLVSDFQRMNSALDQVKSDANQSLQGLATDVNDMLKRLASLNGQIQQMEFQGSDANELQDSRDKLIQEISEKVAVTFRRESDGTVSVSLPQGATLVTGNLAGSFSLEPDSNNNGFFKVMLTGPGGTTKNDVTQILQRDDGNQGEIGATLQVRDSLVNDFISGLDELAYNLATQVNSLHSTGYNLNGATGVNFFSPPAAPAPPATFTAGYSRSISMNISNTNEIAAAATDPTVNGTTGDNGNAIRIAALASQSVSMSTGNSTLSEYYNTLVGKAGVASQTAQRGAAQSSAGIKQLQGMRDSIAGVSLDEELANLITFQKSYEGAAKLINVGTEMLNTVLSLVQ